MKQNGIIGIAILILGAAIIIGAGLYAGLSNQKTQTISLGDTIYSAPPLFETSLATAISASATSMTLVNGTQKDGTALSGSYCFTVDSGFSSVEYICGTASSTSITSLVRGVGADGVTSYPALEFAHRSGADVKITDFPVIQQHSRVLNGVGTFPNILSYATSVTSSSFTNGYQIITKDYADSLTAPATYWTKSGNNLYYTTGNIGIGTTTPQTGLSLIGSSTISGNESVGGLISAGQISVSATSTLGVLNVSGAATFSGGVTSTATTSLSNTIIGGTTTTISSTNLNISSATTTFSSKVILASSTPIDNNEATRKLYVDTKATGISSTTSAITVNTYYYATTSGIAIISGYTDSNGGTLTGLIGLTTSTVSSVVSWTHVGSLSSATYTGSLTFPVPVGYWYKSTLTGTGSSGGGGVFYPFAY